MQHTDISRRTFTAGTLAAIAAPGYAQQYPSGQIRIVVPVVPGGGIDNGARFLADKLRTALAQTVVIDNKPGANYAIGTAFVAKAPPDGYTLLFTANGHIVLPLIASKMPYDAMKDFVPVGTLGYTPYVMLVNNSLPVNTVQEFIAYAKARPNDINFGSGGVGAGSHMAGEVFKELTGIRMQHVPFKGGGPAMTELMGGRIQVNWNTVNASTQLVKAGKVKALAISAESRWPSLPNVPTFAEAGMPKFEERAWVGLFAPAGTPKAAVDRLSAEMLKFLSAPGAAEQLLEHGFIPFPQTPAQFAEMLRNEIATIAPIVKSQNIKLDG
jgi:tripartite-type tricarboxylate transporter receptor subunit TctC